ncbi:MAG: hypothetical protein K2X38_00620 [Gemmataceae bacterium]|nr:hypothetical protein [Gemmataceae bacterium]
MQKSLDSKLNRIHADPHGCKDFILADAKDADMAMGISSPGRSPEAHAAEGRFRSLQEYRDLMEAIVRQGHVDIMLMSAHSNDVLNLQKRIFDNSQVTPAARANDTTDIHIVTGSKYPGAPSMPFRTATLDHIQCGHMDCKPEERKLGADLGLYSITFNNDTVLDRQALEAYREFRVEAERKGFRHFLEIFDPNRPDAVDPAQLPRFINDAIVRTLAGVAVKGRPVFLKMVYHGPKAMEELVAYDPHLVIGILGGGAGTTYDAFKLLAEAKKYGARVALFGRKINNAENQLAFITFLRFIADGQITPEEAVKAYHGVLQNLGVKPQRSLADDMKLQTNVMSYGGGGSAVSLPVGKPEAKKTPASNGKPAAASSANGKSPASDALPDFSKMSTSQKVEWQRQRWNRILG